VNAIDSYRFGQVIVNGRRYTSDIIISFRRIRGNWQRRMSHQLCLQDIAEVIAENPEVLIVGTGSSGLMKVLPEVEKAVDAQGMRLIAETTDKACHTYNQLCQSQRVAAALHLTC